MTASGRQQLLDQLSKARPSIPDELNLLANGPGAHAATVVLVHPVGGTLFCYRQLVAALRKEFRVVGIEARRTTLERYSDSPLSELAAEYVAILDRANGGFVVLCGWSHGGLIAWEMAEHLRRAGRSVPTAVLLDTIWPVDPDAPSPTTEELADWFVEDLARTNQLEPADIHDSTELAHRLDLDESLADELMILFSLNSRVFMRHAPTPAPLEVIFVAAAGTPEDQLAEVAQRGAGLVPVAECDHYSLLVSQIGVTACADAIRTAASGDDRDE